MNTIKITIKKLKFALLLALPVSLPSYAQFPEANKVLPGVTVLEAEALELTGIKVVSDKTASKGKAVKMLSKESVASTTVALEKGEYVANVIMFADNFEGDGFYLSVDDKVKRTATAHHHNRWVYGTKFITFETDGKKPVTLRVSSRWKDREQAEAGMFLDRIEIIELNNSADVLDYWTGSN